ncbi:type II secretion system protein F [Planctomonas sp. JC2975]|uniref:type II secretion system F family protein n=1 Tax=Planctomonas sp. JC2975 TaxID=2729626 RepID=UPI001474125D|nr:type II secretion system F family protein [Planctomonas sp. JC2975]NNC11118.1 type II secretion system protein F [Planctomonas sp. JC2975]
MIAGIALGGALGVGLLLAVSPFFWPLRPRSVPAGRNDRLRRRLILAGMPRLTPAGFLLICALVAVVFFCIAQAVFGMLVLSVALAALGGWLPWSLVSWRAAQRTRAHRTMWPDVVDHLVSAVRSGLALPEGVAELARTAPESTRAAFAAFERDYRSTGIFAPAADRLKAALADPVADRIMETLKMAREVGGGELVSVLKSLAASLREDAAARAEIEARQSWTVAAARLGVAAPWVVLGLLATRPEAALAYNGPVGAVVIVGGLVVTLVAYRMMLSIGRLPEERRWFR